MFDPAKLLTRIRGIPLEPWLTGLAEELTTTFSNARQGDFQKWQSVLAALPAIRPSSMDFSNDRIRIGEANDCDVNVREALTKQLKQLHPWRKGPFELFGIHIDTEWRSDWKWQRLAHEISPLDGRTILDIGCGSGYHCLRMLGAGAGFVLGIEPNTLYAVQFYALRKYAGDIPVYILPFALEDLPDNLRAFDTIFSMGVLYHRRSPFDHLFKLRACLRRGGELVLETLVIDGGPRDVLVPRARYAKMRNVWFVPSTAMLDGWLKRAGFKDVRLIDVTKTSFEEQRATEWMTFESLPDFLHPEDRNLTIEGLPAPQRAMFIAHV